MPLLAVPLPAVVAPLEVPVPAPPLLDPLPLPPPPLVPEGDELPLALALPLEPASSVVSTGLVGVVDEAQAPSSKKAVTAGTPATLTLGRDPGFSFELRVILISNSVC